MRVGLGFGQCCQINMSTAILTVTQAVLHYVKYISNYL